MEASTYQPPRFVPAAEQAKMVRRALKVAHPGVKFSVRCSRGSAINVGWTDGPTVDEVQPILWLYKGGGFDGMQDLRYSVQTVLSTDDGAEVVQFSADFLFANREISDEWKRGVFAVFSQTIGRELDPGDDRGVWSERVPLAVDRTTGKLLHMVDTDLTNLTDVFHQFCRVRQGGSLEVGAVKREP